LAQSLQQQQKAEADCPENKKRWLLVESRDRPRASIFLVEFDTRNFPSSGHTSPPLKMASFADTLYTQVPPLPLFRFLLLELSVFYIYFGF
jgi:hypothetical protein